MDLGFYPVNKYILVQPLEMKKDSLEEENKSSVLIPEEFKNKTKERYGIYKVLKTSTHMNLQVKDKVIVVDNSMVEIIEVDGEKYHLVQENHVVGFFMA